MSRKEAKSEMQAEIKKSQAMVHRLEKEVQMAKEPTERMRDLVWEVARLLGNLWDTSNNWLVVFLEHDWLIFPD